MSSEVFKPYSERVATVVGGKGALGSKITKGLEGLNFQEVRICEERDPFVRYADESDDLFFAVDDKKIHDMLRASRDHLTPRHSILDGSSVKAPLVTTYRELDSARISVASTHLGAVPAQPWRGIKVWVCEVGENSERAKRVAMDLFLSTHSSIKVVDIEDHANVEIDQWITMATAHLVGTALKESSMRLGTFDEFATLNAELLALPTGRTLGQGTNIPSEILFNQPRKRELLAALKSGIEKLEAALESPELLREFMQDNIDFHDADGAVRALFNKAGVIGARNANLRLHSLSFRITNDTPGLLSKILPAFYQEEANLNAIDSMPGIATAEDLQKGIDPDRIVDFHIGIDPDTIDPEKEKRIKNRLIELGCTV